MIFKNIKLKVFVLLAISALTVSCHDDEPLIPFVNYWAEEDPLPGFLSTTQFNQDETPYIDKVAEEIGFAFKPAEKGNIIAVTVKLPDTTATQSVRVTIWDKDLATPIHTVEVPVVAANEKVTFPVGQIELTKGKAYAITMNTTDWYNRRRFDISAMPFPVVSGNIIITGSGFGPGDGQQMPTNLTRPNYYDGDISFIFRRTE
jgi:hypothetical protein